MYVVATVFIGIFLSHQNKEKVEKYNIPKYKTSGFKIIWFNLNESDVLMHWFPTIFQVLVRSVTFDDGWSTHSWEDGGGRKGKVYLMQDRKISAVEFYNSNETYTCRHDCAAHAHTHTTLILQISARVTSHLLQFEREPFCVQKLWMESSCKTRLQH